MKCIWIAILDYKMINNTDHYDFVINLNIFHIEKSVISVMIETHLNNT